jgi:hypothetical protein
MKKLAFLITTALSTAVVILTWSAYIASAAPAAKAPTATGNAAGQALEIAPPVVELKVNPGQTVTAQISLRGVSKDKLLVTSQINDFVAAGEDGTPKILLDSNTEPDPYSLKKWIAPLQQLTLEPHQIKNLPVTIKVPANAAPGGYYGVVRFTATAPELKDTGVSLSASLGSLLFVRVNGEVKEGLKIDEFSTGQNGRSGWLFETGPVDFTQRIKNTGNVHEEPAGQITITDMFGKKVATVNINLPPRNILPQSTRKFQESLDKAVIGDMWLFGRYQADLRVTYGDSKQVIVASLTFWVIPYKLIILVLVALIGGFFILRFFIRRYNRSVIRKAQGGGSFNKRR